MKDRFREQLASGPFYVYLNAGQKRFPYRMKVDAFTSVHGSEGIVSPWPQITDDRLVGLTRDGDSNARVFKTWFQVSKLEALDHPLTLNDFRPASGEKQSALLNQSAFGYAHLRGGLEGGEERLVEQRESNTNAPRNLIFYGPPGTGKTRRMREAFADYTDRASGVDYDTWLLSEVAKHRWRVLIAAALNELGGDVPVRRIRDHRWIQAKIKQRGRSPESIQQTIWGFLQEHTPEHVQTVRSTVRRPPFIFSKDSESKWSLLDDWREQDPAAAEVFDLLKKGPGESGEAVKRYRVVTFHPSFGYEDFIRGIRPVAVGEEGSTEFRLVDGVFKQICDEAHVNPSKRYALFIDEINRANIAKVFGELITLIEPDKRAVFDSSGTLLQGMAVQLPGGDGTEIDEPPFGVPNNLDIYGTMNTADRSIALLDIALRRRFEFEEMEPDLSVLDRVVDGIHLGRLLERLNDRLEYLLDRDHRIGHGYLTSVETIDGLRHTFESQIIPLLQEYFFDDFARVAEVLSTVRGAPPFVDDQRVTRADLFPTHARGQISEERHRYRVTPKAYWTVDSFRGLYASDAENTGDPS